jgi:flagellar biosynthetic protein FliQ
MTPETVVDIFREAFLLILIIVCVLVVPSLFVGLAVSVFQAATQINEQTLSFLPRLITTFVTIMLAGPWLIKRLTDFMSELFTQFPHLIG